MQTFLPYPSFAESARVLDRARLGKQRVEAYQVLRVLLGLSHGWSKHPAVRMWRGHERALFAYAAAICAEWKRRGYNEGVTWTKIVAITVEHGLVDINNPAVPPPWVGALAFHASHRAALLFKFPLHYGQFGWTEEPRVAYVWPTMEVRS